MLSMALFPLINLLVVSFQGISIIAENTSFQGGLNYARMVSDERMWNSLLNTIVLLVVALPIELVLGVAMALLFVDQMRGRQLFISALILPMIIAPIVAGAANNQLESPHDGERLHRRSILYAPDFVINSGGLIRVATMYDQKRAEKAIEQIYQLNDKLIDIFERSAAENIPTSHIAEEMALERLQ